MEQALSMADENRIELEKVLAHYSNDSLKLEAAQYLIRNMPFHFSRIDYLMSPNGKRYVPDITDFPDNIAVQKHCDSLLNKGYRIEKELVYDIKTLKSDYLIQNIDLAFQVWEKPWAREVSFGDFCRCILPYRSQNEPISYLRGEFMQRYMPLLDSANVDNPFEACKIINARFMKELKYKSTGSPLYPTVDETYRSSTGECEGLCNLNIQVMRALGIPVVVQVTTWTKMDMAHNWCAVLYDGEFHDFSPAYDQPGSYINKLKTVRNLKPAKVYRSLYEPEMNEPEVDDDGYVTNLKSPFLRDVTREGGYAVLDMQVEADKPVSSSKSQVYLCAYNYYQWEPIAIGIRDGSMCEFKDVVGNNIFMVAEAAGKRDLKYISAPFFIDSVGNIRKFIPEMNKFITQVLEKKKEESPRILHFWNTEKDYFQLIKCDSITSDTTQFYTRIPDNALLWYTTPHRAMGQRVGFLENGKLKRTWDF